MKKQFESEIERVAPFRTELQAEIIRKTKEKKGFQYRIVFSGFIGLVAICALIFWGPLIGFDLGGGNSATDIGVPNEKGKALIEDLPPLTNIPILVKYSFDGNEWITNNEIQKTLKETWNAISWNPNAELDIDTEHDYKIAMKVRRDIDAPIEELTFYLWYDGDRLIINGDFGYGVLEGDVAYMLASIVLNSRETLPHGMVSERSKTDFEIMRYSIFKGYIVDEESLIKKMQTVFDEVEWMPGVEVQWKRGPDVSMRMWVKEQGKEKASQELLHFYIRSNEVRVTGTLGEARIHSDIYNDFITLLQLGGEMAFTVRTPENEMERKEFQWILSKMADVNYEVVNGETLVPEYALLLDGEVHYIFEGEGIGEVVHISQLSLNYEYSTKDGSAVLEKLRSYTNRDIQKLFAEIAWQDGMVSMTRQFDLQFNWGEVGYDVWLNEHTRGMTIVPNGNHQKKWAQLNGNQSKQLSLYLRELGYGVVE